MKCKKNNYMDTDDDDGRQVMALSRMICASSLNM